MERSYRLIVAMVAVANFNTASSLMPEPGGDGDGTVET